jgi:flagellin-like hook-associated protein FlgL
MESAQGEHERHQGDARVSLEINTIIAAIDAAGNLSRTEPSTSPSIQRLSSGLPTNQPILQQAGISMLPQAQKQPQAVLPLLLK